MPRLGLSVAVLSLVSCGSSPAEIVLVVDTNLCLEGERAGFEAEYDRIDVEVVGGSESGPIRRCALFGGANDPPCVASPARPFTLSVTSAGTTGQITVRVRASLAGVGVAEQVVYASFVSGERRLLEVRLRRSCLVGLCPATVQPTEAFRDEPGRLFSFENGATCGGQRSPSFPIASIAAGDEHACFIDSVGAAFCWGQGTAIGLSGSVSCARRIGIIEAEAAALGGGHTCFRKEDGSVVCLGRGEVGQLGDGQAIFQPCCSAMAAGVAGAQAVAAGSSFTCVIDDGALGCFGRLSTYANTQSNVWTPLATAARGTLEAIDIGSDHACVLDEGGDIVCFGANHRGQLGRGTENPPPVGSMTPPYQVPAPVGGGPWVAVALGARSTCAMRTDGSVYCWGENEPPGLLGFPANGDSLQVQTSPRVVPGLVASAIRAGDGFFCARVGESPSAGELRCWGNNAEGRLGNGDTTQSDSPVPVAVEGGPYADFALGVAFGCAVPEGLMALPVCWGWNLNARLGNSTTEDWTATPTPIQLCE